MDEIKKIDKSFAFGNIRHMMCFLCAGSAALEAYLEYEGCETTTMRVK